DDAILSLRTNELELGLWIFRTLGDPEAVAAIDRYVLEHQHHWFVREGLGLLRRTCALRDVWSRSMCSIVTPGSCFAGTLLELAFASDRIYMLHTEEEEPAASLMLSAMNFGALPMVNGQSRLAARFYGDVQLLDALHHDIGVAFSAAEALSLGLVTDAPDALAWEDELAEGSGTRGGGAPGTA